MNIIADKNILLLDYFFSKDSHSIQLFDPQHLDRALFKAADILMTRSTLKINQDLLKNTSIHTVLSVVTGTDHLDIEYLNQANIEWYATKGCNANAVVDYVLLSLLALAQKGVLKGYNKKAAIIGVGTIGSKVSKLLKKLGFSILECDPPKAERESNFTSCQLEEIQNVDLICMHTPLTQTGKYATYHMIEGNFLSRQKPGCILLNAGRGEIIDTQALKIHGTHLNWCFDVWENEPNIDPEVVQKACIATPHIAGHALQSKWRGTEMAFNYLAKQYNWPQKNMPNKQSYAESGKTWQTTLLNHYNPLLETEILQAESKAILPRCFTTLRKAHKNRMELSYLISPDGKKILKDITLLA